MTPMHVSTRDGMPEAETLRQMFADAMRAAGGHERTALDAVISDSSFAGTDISYTAPWTVRGTDLHIIVLQPGFEHHGETIDNLRDLADTIVARTAAAAEIRAAATALRGRMHALFEPIGITMHDEHLENIEIGPDGEVTSIEVTTLVRMMDHRFETTETFVTMSEPEHPVGMHQTSAHGSADAHSGLKALLAGRTPAAARTIDMVTARTILDADEGARRALLARLRRVAGGREEETDDSGHGITAMRFRNGMLTARADVTEAATRTTIRDRHLIVARAGVPMQVALALPGLPATKVVEAGILADRTIEAATVSPDEGHLIVTLDEKAPMAFEAFMVELGASLPEEGGHGGRATWGEAA